MDKYENPDNTEEILQKLNECKNFFEVQDLIADVFPELIIDQTSEYSPDYSYLESNWENMCKKMGVRQQYIIIVDFIPLINTKFSLINKFFDTMSRNGFVVRRKEELILCGVCRKALLSANLYNMMKYKNDKRLPKSWSKNCKNCFNTKITQ